MITENVGFLSRDCKSEDDKGELTSCFIHNLGNGGPVSADDMYKLAFSHIRERILDELGWLFELIKEAAMESKFDIQLPLSKDEISIGQAESYINMLMYKGKGIIVNRINDKFSVIFTGKYISKYSKYALEELGFVVHIWDAAGEKRIYISWDK